MSTIFNLFHPPKQGPSSNQNKGHLASRYITVVHDMCISIWSRWMCLPWLTDVLMVHYCVKQIHNSTLALYSNLLKKFTKRTSLDMFHNLDMHCNLQFILDSSGCWMDLKRGIVQVQVSVCLHRFLGQCSHDEANP